MNLDLSDAELGFRHTAREFLVNHLPGATVRAQRLTTTVFSEYDVSRAWHQVLFAQGWAAPAWPREHGGTGWNITERYLWSVECARAGAPTVSPIALTMVGPILMRFGTQAQRERFLPRILSAEDYWCQGFSEPGAGSDLSALRMRAVPDGADYVLDGSKIWTTHAHYANWMIALVRTADTGKRQAGITCLLVDMQSPGISVRPIFTIGGDHEVNQVFFDGVRVPQENRVAAEGEGWAVAKYLLEFERGGVIASAALRSELAEVASLAEGTLADLPCVAFEPEIQRGIAAIGIDIDALEMLELRINCALRTGQNPGAAASILKLRASQLEQAVSALAVRVLGDNALRWEATRPLYSLPKLAEGEEAVWPIMSRYLNARANTIFGGSSEIQKGIIARAMLGL
jgi:acyl-CoA dehydrogenase